LTHSGHLDASSMALVRVLVLRTPDEADTCKSALEPLAPHLQERAHDVVRLSHAAISRACCWQSRHCKRVFACVHDQRWSLRVFEARLTARCCRCCGCANSLWGNSPPASSMMKILFRAYLHRRSLHPGFLLLLLLLPLLLPGWMLGRVV
jgi:hypothetical protein